MSRTVTAASGIVERFELDAAELPFDPDAVDGFNTRIQLAIESAERISKENQTEALALAQVKFLANQRFDKLRRAKA